MRIIGLILACIITAAAQSASTDRQSGYAVFQRWCAGCHIDSPLAPGSVALKAARGPAAAVLEQRTDLSAELIRTMVRRGYGAMPSFRRTEISVAELDAVITYLSKTNAAGVNR